MSNYTLKQVQTFLEERLQRKLDTLAESDVSEHPEIHISDHVHIVVTPDLLWVEVLIDATQEVEEFPKRTWMGDLIEDIKTALGRTGFYNPPSSF
jgi:hypothetical protein